MKMAPQHNGNSVTDIRPFEWLTSPASLGELVKKTMRNREQSEETSSAVGNNLSALHVGCGSSTVGEYLVQALDFGKVVNVDRDEEIMGRMEQRWRGIAEREQQKYEACSMEFLTLDFTKNHLPDEYNNSFDLVLDKSTLDCTLCSDIATASLLLEVYRTLKADGGVYMVISFHELDLLLPLLRDLPGASWTVEHTTMERQVEQLHGDNAAIPPKPKVVSENDESPTKSDRKPLNVLICRRRSDMASGNQNGNLNFEEVCEHIHRVNDRWFQEQQPLLTEDRIRDLRHAFRGTGEATKDVHLPLEEAFLVVFTEAEREHLTYEHFMEDWEAFQEARRETESRKDSKSMSLDIAIDFLKEMQ